MRRKEGRPKLRRLDCVYGALRGNYIVMRRGDFMAKRVMARKGSNDSVKTLRPLMSDRVDRANTVTLTT